MYTYIVESGTNLTVVKVDEVLIDSLDFIQMASQQCCMNDGLISRRSMRDNMRVPTNPYNEGFTVLHESIK